MPYLCFNKTSHQFCSPSMAVLQEKQPEPIHTPTCSLDFLYCEEDDEDNWSDGIQLHHHQIDEEETVETTSSPSSSSSSPVSFDSFLLSSSSSDNDDADHQQLQDELTDLISKEEKEMEQNHLMIGNEGMTSRMMMARREAIDWMTKANAHHGFSALTLVLAVNYFDRFALNTSPLSGYCQEKLNNDGDYDDQVEPWMIQLVSIACLSLASKIEETDVPLLLDFQVDSKYIFEAKTVKRMELLVLSTLQWRMNPVTPFSYFEHLIRIPGLKNRRIKSHFHQEILSISERLIVSLLPEQVILYYPPSVIAAAAMLHAMGELQLWTPLLDCQIQILDALKLDKEKLEECCKFIAARSSNINRGYKRQYTWLLEEPLCKRSRGNSTSSISSTSI